MNAGLQEEQGRGWAAQTVVTSGGGSEWEGGQALQVRGCLRQAPALPPSGCAPPLLVSAFSPQSGAFRLAPPL